MAFRGPVEGDIFLEKVCKWMSESCEVGDEGSLVSEDSEDFPNFFYVSKGPGPIM